MSNNNPQNQASVMGLGDVVFESKHAGMLSLPEAILLWYVHFDLLEYDESYGFIKRENERLWCLIPMQELRERFPFWSRRTIIRVRKNLQDRGVLLRHDLPDEDISGGVATWYSIDYDTLRKILNRAK